MWRKAKVLSRWLGLSSPSSTDLLNDHMDGVLTTITQWTTSPEGDRSKAKDAQRDVQIPGPVFAADELRLQAKLTAWIFREHAAKDEWESRAVDSESIAQCLDELVMSEYGKQMFGVHDMCASVG
ncbi:hypothetical protein THAOC_07763, partial [Thalassiosira oceanica]